MGRRSSKAEHAAAVRKEPLERELAQLRAVYAALHDALLVFDAGGAVVVANEAAARMAGYSTPGEMKRHLAEFAEIFELFEADGSLVSLQAWPAERLLRGEHIESVELGVRRKDTGRESFVRFSGEAVKDEHGTLVLAVLLMADVTGRVRREQALRDGEERFRALADSMPQLVWMAGPDGVVDYYNARAAEYAGLERAPDGSWRWEPLVHPDDREATVRAWSEALENRSHYECEHRVRMADGTYRWHVSRARLVRSALGEKWFGTATDLHDRKLAEENLRQAMAMRGQVVSAVAHDLRNPLNVVRLAVPMLRQIFDNCADAVARQRGESYLVRLDRQVAKMEKLLAEFLDAATLQAGQPLALEHRRSDLLAMVRELLSESSREGATHPIELVTSVTSVVGDWDLDRLERVLSNLLSNALKYSPPGTPVTVVVERSSERVSLRVSDRGMGIAEQDLQRIFHWFTRGGNAERVTRGIGIGLAGARDIVEQHGGSLTVESKLGAGSTFTIELPVFLNSTPPLRQRSR